MSPLTRRSDVIVTAYDPTLATGTRPVTIMVTDVNEAPTVMGDATGSILEIGQHPAGELYLPPLRVGSVHRDRCGRRRPRGSGILTIR